MEALLDELLEGVPGQELGDEVPGFPDGVDDPDSGSNEQDDEGQHHIEAEVAKAAKRSLAYSLALPAVTESGSRCLTILSRKGISHLQVAHSRHDLLDMPSTAQTA